jgi:non-specific serine/threonine protein kinase/serine/threonine-protein kinase
MTDDDHWQRVKSVFGEVVSHPPGQWSRLLDDRCDGDAELRAEVESLLEAHRTRDPVLDKPVAPVPLEVDPLEGASCGPYKLMHRVGRGGMGSVYLAVRDDEHIRRRVAVKLVPPGTTDDHMLRRFQTERKVLAALDHPNIVKLLDAGTSPFGVPYLVMDYVEGEPIARYCESHGLSVEARIAIFRKVCAAVLYAHQNLVVHRDLKPDNILVTHDGEPKLLDFGIAKILLPEALASAFAPAWTQHQPLTVAYASPEQLQGRAITTATDVYSLGAVLYELVSGRTPHQGIANTMAEMERAVAEGPPERPSAVAPPELRNQIPHDLDAVVLKALRSEPERRYQSVEQFSDDLRRLLESRPVSAGGDSLVYRFRKFASRRRGLLAAVVATAAGLLIATVVSVRSARLAESRLEAVREFAGAMTVLDEAARTGSTALRQKAVARSLAALNRLAEGASDASLRRDLAEFYLLVGDVQGNPHVPNLGDLAGARKSYQQALELAQAMGPGVVLAKVRSRLGDFLSLTDDPHLALAEYEAAAKVLAQLPRGDAATDRERVLLHESIGMARYHVGDLDGARQSFRDAVRESADSADPSTRTVAAHSRAREGELLARKGGPADGIPIILGALADLESLQRADPNNPSLQRSVAVVRSLLGDVLHGAGKRDEAIDSIRRGAAALGELARRDPMNLQYRRDYVSAATLLANFLALARRDDEARRLTTDTIDLLSRNASRTEASWHDHNIYAWFLLTTPLQAHRDPREARRHAELACEKSRWSNISSLMSLGLAREALGDRVGAVEALGKALALLPPPIPGQPPTHNREELESAMARVKSQQQ